MLLCVDIDIKAKSLRGQCVLISLKDELASLFDGTGCSELASPELGR